MKSEEKIRKKLKRLYEDQEDCEMSCFHDGICNICPWLGALKWVLE